MFKPRAVLVTTLLLLLLPLAARGATHRMFVTSGTHDGDLGQWLFDLDGQVASGAAAGDGVCKYYAQQAGLDPTHFRAWLSTTTDDAFCRILRDLDHPGHRSDTL